jgi:hypothetical protein
MAGFGVYCSDEASLMYFFSFESKEGLIYSDLQGSLTLLAIYPFKLI